MTFDQWIDRIDITRSQIEAKFDGPAVINVSSAMVEDGAASLAKLLAYSFARAGQATILVEAQRAVPTNPVRPASDLEALLRSVRCGSPGAPDLLELDVTAPRSTIDTQGLYARLRSRYAVTISSQCLSEYGGAGMSLASQSDTVVISVRNGRGAGDSDVRLKDLFASLELPVAGVVLVERDAIKAVGGHQWKPGPTFLSVADQETFVRRKAMSV